MNFDLNIDNYTKAELIDMFQLPSSFDQNIVEIQETKLRDNILKNNKIDKDTQSKTVNFLIQAKKILLDNNSDKKESSNSNKTNQSNIDDYFGGTIPPSITDDLNLLEYNKYYSDYKLTKNKIIEQSGNHDIVTREVKPHIQSYPSETYEGVVNPLKKRLVYKNVVIDTQFRDNYYNSTSTNFNFYMPTQFNNVTALKLTSLEFPCYFYAISKSYGNNFFNITVENNGNNQTTVVTIPDGNYDPVSVTNAINTTLSNLGDPFDKVTFNVGIAQSSVISSYLLGDGRMYVGPNSNNVTLIQLDFQSDIYGQPDFNTQLPLKLGWMLGFRNGAYKESLNYISEAPVNVYGTKYIYIVLDDFHNNVSKNFYGLLNSSILNNNILAKFSLLKLNKPFTFYVDDLSTNDSAPPREYFGPVNLQNFRIQILDEFGRTLDLNNMDYSMTFRLNCIYDL